MKEIWSRVIGFGYSDDPSKMWQDRHVRVTIGEDHVDKIYYLFNNEEVKNTLETYQTLHEQFDLDFSTQFLERRKSFKDLSLDQIKHPIMGICGEMEVIKSDNRREFKIEFL